MRFFFLHSGMMKRTPEHENIILWLESLYDYAKTGFAYQSDNCRLPCSVVSAKVEYLHSRKGITSCVETCFKHFSIYIPNS